MAGVNKINMYPLSINGYYKDKPLTAVTRAKLMALGVSTAGIRTEAEGQRKLRRAEEEQAERARYNEKSAKTNSKGQVDENLEKARKLAKELNLSVSENENITQLISRIKTRLTEMKTAVKDDFDKNSYIGAYQDRLDVIVASDMSQSQLSTSMSLTANMNIAFHGLY